MDFTLTPQELTFADEVRTWLEEHLVGDFTQLRGKGGTGQEDISPELLIAWEKELAGGGWLGLDYPEQWGGREASLMEQVVFHTTYVQARAPGRMPNMGVTLLGPTLLAFGTEQQKQRFIPEILAGTEFWCQGYSEPNAGSDLANVATRAELRGDRWVINGQKVWTSLAQFSDWCFVVCRTDPETQRHAGLSYLLVPMDQTGVEIRPIVQITGGTEFNEVFFSDAETPADMVVGEPGGGWGVAMGTLAFERGASTLGQQLSFRQEFDRLLARAQSNGASRSPVVRDGLARSFAELEIMRYNNLRILSAAGGAEMSIGKLFWSHWHRDFGELAMQVEGADGLVADGATDATYPLGRHQRTFLYSRAHTIYAGSSEIQKNIIAERVLGLPR